MIKPLKIKDVTIKNNVFLAPLAGVSEIAFRGICKMFGAGLTYTEMVSCKGLAYGNKKTKDLLKVSPLEDVKAAQLFGGQPDFFVKALHTGDIDGFDIVDINMGCPVKKVVNNFEGSYLLSDMPLARSIISACVNNTKKPVTVKFRSGYNDKNIVAVDFAKMCQDAGASMICVHGRTREQMYKGQVDYSVIEDVKKAVNIPVIGNGDIFNIEQAKRMFDCGVDAVMVARGALGNPRIFAEILQNGIDIPTKQIILYHINTLKESFGDKHAAINIRKHIAWYLKGGLYKQIREQINSAKNCDILEEIITKSL